MVHSPAVFLPRSAVGGSDDLESAPGMLLAFARADGTLTDGRLSLDTLLAADVGP